MLAPFGLVQDTPKVRGQLAFLSHSTSDVGSPIREVDDVLRSLGVETFIAHRDIRPSLAWREEIKRHLAICTVFVALLTDHYHESEWCDQEFGYVLSRPDVVVVPVRVTTHSYGFLSDHQELPWRTGRFVRSTENGDMLATCLIDRGVVDRASIIRGLAVAPNFHAADVGLNALSVMLATTPLSAVEAPRVAAAIIANDQIHRNNGAIALFPGQLAPHLAVLGEAARARLVELKFASPPNSYRRY